jgi:curved DNA-binding protein
MADLDYYKILNVSKTASDSEIKKAYRKLAMKYHPDHAKGDSRAEERFKEISEAYAVLSDKTKRQKYDTFGSAGFHQRFSQEDIFRGFDLGEIFKEFGFGGGNMFTGRGGGQRFSFGSGSPFGFQSNPQQTQQMKGSNLVYEMPLTLQEIVSGTTKSIAFQHGGQAHNLTVKIPKGMITGKKLRIAGKGEQSRYGGPPGDLFVQAKIISDPTYRIEEYDLHMNREIKLSEAILGKQVAIPTLTGKDRNLTIPPGTRHKTKMRLVGHGLPFMKGKKKGDLYVHISVYMPKNLTHEQEALVEKLSETGL